MPCRHVQTKFIGKFSEFLTKENLSYIVNNILRKKTTRKVSSRRMRAFIQVAAEDHPRSLQKTFELTGWWNVWSCDDWSWLSNGPFLSVPLKWMFQLWFGDWAIGDASPTTQCSNIYCNGHQCMARVGIICNIKSFRDDISASIRMNWRTTVFLDFRAR